MLISFPNKPRVLIPYGGNVPINRISYLPIKLAFASPEACDEFLTSYHRPCEIYGFHHMEVCTFKPIFTEVEITVCAGSSPQ
jgi:hypothetical protein